MSNSKHTHFECAVGCSVEATLELIGGKWKGVILYHLLQESVLRFSQLQKLFPSCTQRTLTNQLRALEADGFVKRVVYAQVRWIQPVSATPIQIAMIIGLIWFPYMEQ